MCVRLIQTQTTDEIKQIKHPKLSNNTLKH